MARFTDEEREEKILEIADYIIETNSSTRKADEQFGISNATVSDWMNSGLNKLDNKKFLKVGQILKQNKPKTITDEAVRQRVLNVANLIKDGFTAQEIANSTNISIHIINEDLQTRLPRISQELYTEVKSIQLKNSIDNLQIGRNMTASNQKRDNNGRFTK